MPPTLSQRTSERHDNRPVRDIHLTPFNMYLLSGAESQPLRLRFIKPVIKSQANEVREFVSADEQDI